MASEQAEAERGAAAVEFALVSLLLVTLLLGIIDFAYGFFIQGNLAGAAREGVRAYAISGQAADGVTAANGYVSAAGLSDSAVVPPPTGCPGGDGTMTLTYDYSGITGLLPVTIELSGTARMRCEG